MARSRQSTPEQRLAFGVALKEAAQAAGVGTTTALAAYLTENDVQTGQTTVSSWFRGKDEPPRPTLVAIEELLGLEPGELSCRLGWLPVGSHIDDIEAAILADPRYTPAHADAIIAMLRTFRQ